MKEVIVQIEVGSGAARRLSHGPFAAAKDFGLTLEAIHPKTNDPSLSRWFHAEVDNEKAAEFVKVLQESPGVTAAYVKPPTEAP